MTDGPLRVLHLIDQLNPGGAERFTMHAVSRLDGARFDRTLCATRQTGNFWPGDTRAEAMAELEHSGVRVIELNRQGRFDVKAFAPLMRELRRRRTQILHAHMLGSNLWGTVLGRLAGVPVVIAHEHGSPDEVALSRRVADRYVLGRGVDAYLAVCEPDRRRLVDAGGVPEERTRILANGILTPEVDPSRDMRAELGLPADAVVVGTVGILRKEKAHHVLVRAAARVREHHPELHVVIVGDGVERMPLEELAEELGIRDAVHFIGVRADVPQVLTAFDIAANSSDREGSPLSVMEYMEARLPVVATRVGAVPEIVRDGVHGRVVPPGDPEAMAGALRELLGDRERAAEMGRRGQERRRSEYDLDVVASRLGALYEELWAARSARSR